MKPWHSTPPICRFLFGTELELLLTPKPHVEVKNWNDAAQALSRLLWQESIQNEVLDDSTNPNYKHWNITGDGSIRQDRKAQRWGVELISNILFDMKRGDWKNIQQNLWRCLESQFDIVPSESCGTHVHVSLYSGRRGWDLQRLKRVAKAVVYFERCVDSLMPAHRLQNKFCRSNRYNPALQDMSMTEIFQAIDEIEPEDGHSMLANLLSPDRYYRWNFVHMTELRPRARTIEFRQPPGSTTVGEAIFWPQFTLAFISSAFQKTFLFDPNRAATLAELRTFLGGGLLTRSVDSRVFDDFFTGKQQIPEGMYREAPLTSEDLMLVRAKDRVEILQGLKLQTAFESLELSDEEN